MVNTMFFLFFYQVFTISGKTGFCREKANPELLGFVDFGQHLLRKQALFQTPLKCHFV